MPRAHSHRHRHRLLRPHAGAAGAARRLLAAAAPATATCRSTSTTPWRTARWPSARPCARHWATSAASAAIGFLLPMDEAQVQVAIDLSGRTLRRVRGQVRRDRGRRAATELVPHFFRSLAESLRAALHVSVTGDNTHHMVEACFKGVGRALRQAVRHRGHGTAVHQGSAVSSAAVPTSRSSTAAAPTSPRCCSPWSAWGPRRGQRRCRRTASRAARAAAGCRRRTDAMERLAALGLVDVIPTLTQPVLGICLGMQLLFDAQAQRRTTPVPGHPSRPGRALRGPRPTCRCRTWAGTRCEPCAPTRCCDGSRRRAYVYFVHSYAAPVRPRHAGATRLRRRVHGGGAARQFPRRAVPPRALRRRRARACWPISCELD